MSNTEDGRAQADHYREIAGSIRALIPLMQYAAVRDQLGLLALEYERLAQCVETMPEALQTPTGTRSD
jgi:hypothetical protein